MEELLDKLEHLSLDIWQANAITNILYDYATYKFDKNDEDKITALAIEVNNLTNSLNESIEEALKQAYEVRNETK